MNGFVDLLTHRAHRSMGISHHELGSSGISVSAFGLGSWHTWERLPREQAAALLDHARSRGIDYLDVVRMNDETGRAPIPTGYNEVAFGEAFRASGWPRDEVTIAEALWWEFWPRESPTQELEASLARVGIDHVDLVQTEPPPPEIAMDEFVGMMGELVASGRSRAWGLVNWSPPHMVELARAVRDAGVPGPAMTQVKYSLVVRGWVEDQATAEALDLCGASLIAANVLGGGVLSGKYARGSERGRWSTGFDHPHATRALTVVPALLELADRLGEPPSALAFAFALAHPRVATIQTAAMRPEHIDQSLRALDVLERLSDDGLAELRAIGADVAARTDRLTCFGDRRAFEEDALGAAGEATSEAPVAVIFVALEELPPVDGAGAVDENNPSMQVAALGAQRVAAATGTRLYRAGDRLLAVLAAPQEGAEPDDVHARLRTELEGGPPVRTAACIVVPGEHPSQVLERAQEALRGPV